MLDECCYEGNLPEFWGCLSGKEMKGYVEACIGPEGAAEIAEEMSDVCDTILAGEADNIPFSFMGKKALIVKAANERFERRDGKFVKLENLKFSKRGNNGYEHCYKRKNVIRTYEKMKSDSRCCTFVADVNGGVVGFATTVETIAIDHPNGYIKMNGLAVLPEFQHRGIGKMLMERVEKLAGERSASAIGLASGFQRTGAHKFYEYLGYKKTSFWFRKNIECC